jgi:hypothetical protein
MRTAAWIGLILALLLPGFSGDAAAFDFAKTKKQVERAFGRKPADPPPRVRAGERVQRSRAKTGAPPSTEAPTLPDTALVPPALVDEILLTPEPYVYQSIARRDPFVSLVSEDYLAEHEEEVVNLSDFTVRGILWGERDRFALIEGSDGSSYILREGERLGSYTVSRIEPEAILVYISEYGVGRTERLALTEGKGNRNGRDRR